MLRMILDDYRKNWKPAWKRLGQTRFLYFYVAAFGPNFYLWEERVSKYILYYGIMIPIMLGLLFNDLYPNKMNKTLLLCPLTIKEREKYFKMAMALKVGVSMTFVFIGNMILLIFHKLSILGCVLDVLLAVILMISVNLDWQKNEIKMNDPSYCSIGNLYLWQLFLKIFSVITFCIIVSAEIDSPFEIWEAVVVLVFILISAGIGWKIYRTYYKDILHLCTSYEGVMK